METKTLRKCTRCRGVYSKPAEVKGKKGLVHEVCPFCNGRYYRTVEPSTPAQERELKSRENVYRMVAEIADGMGRPPEFHQKQICGCYDCVKWREQNKT